MKALSTEFRTKVSAKVRHHLEHKAIRIAYAAMGIIIIQQVFGREMHEAWIIMVHCAIGKFIFGE